MPPHRDQNRYRGKDRGRPYIERGGGGGGRYGAGVGGAVGRGGNRGAGGSGVSGSGAGGQRGNHGHGGGVGRDAAGGGGGGRDGAARGGGGCRDETGDSRGRDGAGRGDGLSPILDGLPDLGPDAIYLRVPSMDEDEDDYCFVWPEYYGDTIVTIRRSLATERFYPDDDSIWMLPNINAKYFNLVLYDIGREWVVLRFQWKDVYIIGFLNRNGSFQFKDMDYSGWEKLNFTCRYVDLTTTGNCCLNTLTMGIMKLQTVLKSPSQVTMQNNEEINDCLKARSLLTLVVMFSEAVGFEPIEAHFITGDVWYTRLHVYHKYYIENWSKASKCLIVAKAYPERIDSINAYIENMCEFQLPDGRQARNIDDLKLIVRVLSRQSLEDSTWILDAFTAS